jgi:cell wall assembly regulator SMI1
VAEIMALMTTMEDLFGDEGPIEHIAENKIQPVLWDRLWVPFSEFEGTPRLILDLHPGRRGLPGQIFQSFPGVDLEDDATVIAPNFDAFSADLLRTLKNRS